jgi:hypothetical protein
MLGIQKGSHGWAIAHLPVIRHASVLAEVFLGVVAGAREPTHLRTQVQQRTSNIIIIIIKHAYAGTTE